MSPKWPFDSLALTYTKAYASIGLDSADSPSGSSKELLAAYEQNIRV